MELYRKADESVSEILTNARQTLQLAIEELAGPEPDMTTALRMLASVDDRLSAVKHVLC